MHGRIRRPRFQKNHTLRLGEFLSRFHQLTPPNPVSALTRIIIVPGSGTGGGAGLAKANAFKTKLTSAGPVGSPASIPFESENSTTVPLVGPKVPGPK